MPGFIIKYNNKTISLKAISDRNISIGKSAKYVLNLNKEAYYGLGRYILSTWLLPCIISFRKLLNLYYYTICLYNNLII